MEGCRWRDVGDCGGLRCADMIFRRISIIKLIFCDDCGEEKGVQRLFFLILFFNYVKIIESFQYPLPLPTPFHCIPPHHAVFLKYHITTKNFRFIQSMAIPLLHISSHHPFSLHQIILEKILEKFFTERKFREK